MGIPAPPSNDSRARPVAGQYVIEFQDDDGKMTQVAADMVVEVSSGALKIRSGRKSLAETILT